MIDTGEPVFSNALVRLPSTHTSAAVGPRDGPSSSLFRGCSVSFYSTWVVTATLVNDSHISASWSC